MKKCLKCNKLHKRKTNLCPQCYYQENKASIKKNVLRWKSKNRDKWLRIKKYSKIKEQYGITKKEYHEMFKKQNNECAICGKSIKPLDYDSCVDHCHDTRKVRGILCRRCNLALGYFNDDVELLNIAIKYLNNSRN